MKIQELLFEMPRTINPTDFNLSDSFTNTELAYDLLRDKSKTLLKKLDGSGKINLFECKNEFFAIDEREEEPSVIYYMKFQIKFYELLKHQAASQVEVWRNRRIGATDNLAKYIFFNELLYKRKIVITDSMQTPDGQGFWDNRVNDTLKRNDVYLYYVNFIDGKIIKIHNDLEYNKITKQEEIWCEGPDCEKKRIVISTIKLGD